MKKPTTSFLYSLVMDPYSLGYNSNSFDLPLNHKVFLAAFDTIKELASKGPCVFVGRCADYVLKDNPNVVSVFVHADEKFCLDRAMERNSMTRKRNRKNTSRRQINFAVISIVTIQDTSGQMQETMICA